MKPKKDEADPILWSALLEFTYTSNHNQRIQNLFELLAPISTRKISHASGEEQKGKEYINEILNKDRGHLRKGLK